jgi:hypothetical protein
VPRDNTENNKVIEKILRHPERWDMKVRPPPRRRGSSLSVSIDYSDSQIPFSAPPSTKTLMTWQILPAPHNSTQFSIQDCNQKSSFSRPNRRWTFVGVPVVFERCMKLIFYLIIPRLKSVDNIFISAKIELILGFA